MGEERKLCKVLLGKPEAKRPPGISRRMWKDEIIMDLRGIGFVGCG
jgi:hypothetical protein